MEFQTEIESCEKDLLELDAKYEEVRLQELLMFSQHGKEQLGSEVEIAEYLFPKSKIYLRRDEWMDMNVDESEPKKGSSIKRMCGVVVSEKKFDLLESSNDDENCSIDIRKMFESQWRRDNQYVERFEIIFRSRIRKLLLALGYTCILTRQYLDGNFNRLDLIELISEADKNRILQQLEPINKRELKTIDDDFLFSAENSQMINELAKNAIDYHGRDDVIFELMFRPNVRKQADSYEQQIVSRDKNDSVIKEILDDLKKESDNEEGEPIVRCFDSSYESEIRIFDEMIRMIALESVEAGVLCKCFQQLMIDETRKVYRFIESRLAQLNRSVRIIMEGEQKKRDKITQNRNKAMIIQAKIKWFTKRAERESRIKLEMLPEEIKSIKKSLMKSKEDHAALVKFLPQVANNEEVSFTDEIMQIVLEGQKEWEKLNETRNSEVIDDDLETSSRDKRDSRKENSEDQDIRGRTMSPEIDAHDLILEYGESSDDEEFMSELLELVKSDEDLDSLFDLDQKAFVDGLITEEPVADTINSTSQESMSTSHESEEDDSKDDEMLPEELQNEAINELKEEVTRLYKSIDNELEEWKNCLMSEDKKAFVNGLTIEEPATSTPHESQAVKSEDGKTSVEKSREQFINKVKEEATRLFNCFEDEIRKWERCLMSKKTFTQ